jgi:putative heme-binding domain-containing protein
VYGGVFGKDHGVLAGHARTGDLLPVLIQLGPAAACGLHVHSGFGLGSGLGGDAFACSFNLRCVTRHRLSPEAGSFRVESEPLLSGDSADFHPTDVIEDADGSLLVVDTGGWYKLCCPTSQLEKPAVTGAIYRIRREAELRPVDPRGALIDFSGLKAAELVAMLADPRPEVAQRAVERLADLGATEPVGQVLRSSDAVDVARLRAVWCLARIESEKAKAAVRTALGDPAAEVRQAAAHVAGLCRDALATGTLVAMLQEDEVAVARAAAEALGRIGGEDAVSGLLRGAARAEGRILEHSITYALIEAGLTAPLEAALVDENARSRRIAMVALDQLPVFHRNGSTASQGPLRTAVAAAMRSGDPTLQDAGLWILSGHPVWASDIVSMLEPLLDQVARAPADEASELIRRLAPLARNQEVAAAVAGTLADSQKECRDLQLATLRLMRAARPDPVPEAWADGAGEVIRALVTLAAESSGDAEHSTLALAVEVLDSLSLSDAQRERLRPVLKDVATNGRLPTALALKAVRAAGFPAPLPPGVIDRLLTIIEAGPTVETSPLERSDAIDLLAVAALPEADQVRLARNLAVLPAADVARLLPPLTEAGGDALTECLQSLAKHPRPDTLPRDLVAAAVERARADVPAAGELLASIDAAVASQRQRFHDLVSSLPAGDAQRGHRVFLSAKAACTSCHAMAYAGGRIGPDLTRIGSIRTEADLLESIVLPNASFVRSYEPVVVLTTAGTVASGIVSEEQADRLVVQTSATASVVIPRDAIDMIQRGDVSLMPSGYDTLLSPQELADLVAFLARAR